MAIFFVWGRTAPFVYRKRLFQQATRFCQGTIYQGNAWQLRAQMLYLRVDIALVCVV